MDATQTDQVVNEVNEQYKEAVSAVTQQTLLDAVFKEAVAVLIIPLSLVGILFMKSEAEVILSSLARRLPPQSGFLRGEMNRCF